MANLIKKQVVFNPSDPDHKELLKHIEMRTNFSAYIKRLIQRDLESAMVVNFIPTIQKQNELDFDGKGFI